MTRRAILAENHPPQHRRDINRRSVERKKLRGLSRLLDPINVFVRALLEKYIDSIARVANTATEILQFRFQEFVLRSAADFRNSRL